MSAIRPATAGDAAAVADVYLASFVATYDFPLAHTEEGVRAWVAGHVDDEGQPDVHWVWRPVP